MRNITTRLNKRNCELTPPFFRDIRICHTQFHLLKMRASALRASIEPTIGLPQALSPAGDSSNGDPRRPHPHPDGRGAVRRTGRRQSRVQRDGGRRTPCLRVLRQVAIGPDRAMPMCTALVRRFDLPGGLWEKSLKSMELAACQHRTGTGGCPAHASGRLGWKPVSEAT